MFDTHIVSDGICRWGRRTLRARRTLGSKGPESWGKQTSILALTTAKPSWQTLLRRPGMGVEPRITCRDTDTDRLLAGSETMPQCCVRQWQKQPGERRFLFLPPACIRWWLEKFAVWTRPLLLPMNHAGDCFPKVTKIRGKILFAVQWCSVDLAESLASSLKISGAGRC